MIIGLDGLRAVAFLAVLGEHTGIIGFGWMGVQLFFVLSGFLITGILLRMKETLPARQYFYKFYGRRFLRIFPLYFFFLFLLTVAVRYNNLLPSSALRMELVNEVQPQLGYAYLYLQNFFNTFTPFHNTKLISHLWSLSVEEQFYIVWPLLLFFVQKIDLKKFFLLTIALGLASRILVYLIYISNIFPSLPNDPYLAIYALPFSHLDAFAMGAYISQFKLPNARKQLAVLACVIPLLGLSLQYLVKGDVSITSLGYGFTMPTAYKFIWAYSILNYMFALAIHVVDQTGLFERFLDHFAVRYLGKISYGLYVYHNVVIWFIFQYFLDFIPNPDSLTGKLLTYMVALVVTVIIASISFHLLEKPITNMKDRFFPLKAE